MSFWGRPPPGVACPAVMGELLDDQSRSVVDSHSSELRPEGARLRAAIARVLERGPRSGRQLAVTLVVPLVEVNQALREMAEHDQAARDSTGDWILGLRPVDLPPLASQPAAPAAEPPAPRRSSLPAARPLPAPPAAPASTDLSTTLQSAPSPPEPAPPARPREERVTLTKQQGQERDQRILEYLAARGETARGDLMAEFEIPNGSIGGIVDRLRSRGELLVRVEEDTRQHFYRVPNSIDVPVARKTNPAPAKLAAAPRPKETPVEQPSETPPRPLELPATLPAADSHDRMRNTVLEHIVAHGVDWTEEQIVRYFRAAQELFAASNGGQRPGGDEG